MSWKKKVRYLKRIMLYTVIMATIVTIVVLAIGWRAGYIESATVGVLAGMWSVELILGTLIKVNEEKTERAKNAVKNEKESI